MDTIIEFLKVLNGLSPLAIIGLLGIVLFYAVKNMKTADAISNNHLSGLPEMQATLESINETLQRMERTQVALDAYLHARLNGGGKPYA